MHVLHAHGGKAKRISYSTSHAETLSMVNGMESTVLVMVRLSEMMHISLQPTLKELVDIQENGNPALPSDFCMDCRDLFELCTGQKVLPQDKTQRLYVLGIREGRITGRIRQTTLIPTESMTADALTKPMQSPELLQFLTTGMVTIYGVDNHPVVSRILPSLQDYDEQTLMLDDEKLLDYAKENPQAIKASPATMLFGLMGVSTSSTMRMALMMGMATMANAQPAQEPEAQTASHYMGLVMYFVLTYIVVIAAIMTEKYVFQLHIVRKFGLYIANYVFKAMSVKVKVEVDDPMEVDSSTAREVDSLRESLEDLTAERDRLLDYQTVLVNNRDMYKGAAEQANLDLSRAEDRIQDLEDDLQKRDEIVDKRNQEITHALEQKNYNAARIVQITAANKEKDARINDLKEQLRNMGNKAARRDEGPEDGGSMPSSMNRGDDPGGPLGLHRIDMRAMKDALEQATSEKENLMEENKSLKDTLEEKKESIQRMQRVYEEQQKRIRDARFPEEIRITNGGAKYHLANCKHLQRSGRDLPCSTFKRCFDCG